MASSIVLPQALHHAVLTNLSFFQPKRLWFSSQVSSSLDSARPRVSRVCSRSFSGSKLDFVSTVPLNRRFVPRAEGGYSGVVVGGNEEAEVTDGVEGEAGDTGGGAQKPRRKPRVNLGDVMGILNKRAVEASEKERPIPDIRTGDIVEIKLEVPENKRRVSIYKGIVMSRQNAGIHTTIRIRRIIAGVGVEIVFPVYSPNVKEIKVVNHRKVRRARLYYLRDKLPRFSTFK